MFTFKRNKKSGALKSEDRAGNPSICRLGEDFAVRYLKKKGCRILARNFRTRFGELDIICRDGETVVFVEVKTRTSDLFGSPDEAVGPAKRRHLARAAQLFLSEKSWEDLPARFDVLAVWWNEKAPEVDHLVDAFDLSCLA